MGKCARRTKKFVKKVAKVLTPVGIRLIGNIVGIVGTTKWSNDEKRDVAFDLAKGSLVAAGIEAKEAAIRVAIEASADALKDGQAALEELGADMEPEDEAELNAPD